MNLRGVGEPIAKRTLRLHEEGATREVTVVIGKPMSFEDSSGYYCPFQIQGLGSEEVKRELGADAVEAIMSVMKAVGLELYVLNGEHGRRLRWGPHNSKDLGFPVPRSPLRYQSGEEILKGDKVLFHGESAEIEYVADKLTGDFEMDWNFKENGPGVMIVEGAGCRTYLRDTEGAEDLVLVSRSSGS